MDVDAYLSIYIRGRIGIHIGINSSVSLSWIFSGWTDRWTYCRLGNLESYQNMSIECTNIDKTVKLYVSKIPDKLNIQSISHLIKDISSN